MPRKTISLPEDLAEFVDENHINLSRFVQDKLRELSESENQNEELSEDQAKEIAQKLEDLGYLDRGFENHRFSAKSTQRRILNESNWYRRGYMGHDKTSQR